MKNPQFRLLPFLYLGLLTMSVLAWLLSQLYRLIPGLAGIHWLAQLIPAICLMIGAIVCHKKAKGRTPGYLLSYLVNAAGSGCAIGALLGVAAVIPPAELLAALLPAAGLGTLVCLLLLIPGKGWRSFVILAFVILGLALIGVGIYVWICRDSLAGCTMVFSGLFYLPFPVGCSAAREKPERKYRYLSFTGFGAFILIATVVAFILSEGEILNGLDLDLGTGGKKKKAGKM